MQTISLTKDIISLMIWKEFKNFNQTDLCINMKKSFWRNIFSFGELVCDECSSKENLAFYGLNLYFRNKILNKVTLIVVLK